MSTRNYSIAEIEEMERKAATANPNLGKPPVKLQDTIFLPNLFNPETGGYGRDAIVTRLSSTEQLKIASESTSTLSEEDKQEIRKYCREDIDLNDLPALRERAWTLVYGCQEPSFTFVEALTWLGRKDGNDIVQPLLYKINELNERIPSLATYQAAIDDVARFPLAMGQLEAAYLAGEETLRAFLDEDTETVQFIRRWAMTITAAAFSIMQKQAKIAADANAEAILKQFVEFGVQIGRISRETDE